MNIIKTNDGYMVELPNGDYLCDVNGDNLWDTHAEAEATINIFDEVREPLAPEVRTAMLSLIFPPTEGHTTCDVEINTNTAPDNNPVHEAVLFYWGERCPEHEDGCTVCEAWSQYDDMVGDAK